SRNPTEPPGLSIRACAASSAATTPTACRPARNAPSPSSTRPCKRSIDLSRPSSAGSSSPARPASCLTIRSPAATRYRSAPLPIRSTARYRRLWWGKRKDDERHPSSRRDGGCTRGSARPPSEDQRADEVADAHRQDADDERPRERASQVHALRQPH